MPTPTTLMLIMIGSFAATAMGAGWLIMSEPPGTTTPQAGTPVPSRSPERVQMERQNTRTAVATVEKIDKDNRKLTLKTEDGKSTTVDVPEDVQAFEQVKKGDKIRMTYKESLALAVHRPGEAKPTANVRETSRRMQGAQPGRMMERTHTLAAQIVSIDTKRNAIKLKGPDGKIEELVVEDPDVRERLKDMKPGEVVQVDYTEAMAVTLEPASR